MKNEVNMADSEASPKMVSSFPSDISFACKFNGNQFRMTPVKRQGPGERYRPNLLTEMGKGVAQRGTGDCD